MKIKYVLKVENILVPSLEGIIMARDYKNIFTKDGFNFIDRSASSLKFLSEAPERNEGYFVILKSLFEKKDISRLKQFVFNSKSYCRHIETLSSEYDIGTTPHLEEERNLFIRRHSNFYIRDSSWQYSANEKNKFQSSKKQRKTIKFYRDNLPELENILISTGEIQKKNISTQLQKNNLFEKKWFKDNPLYNQILNVCRQIGNITNNKKWQTGGTETGAEIMATAMYLSINYAKQSVILTGDSDFEFMLEKSCEKLKRMLNAKEKASLNVCTCSEFYNRLEDNTIEHRKYFCSSKAYL